MTIQKDAGNLLIFLYDEYIKKSSITKAKEIINNTKWEANRINRAIMYLRDEELVKVEFLIAYIDGVQDFWVEGLTPKGIKVIENKKEFKKNFGFEIGIPGLFKYSWGANEK